MEAWRRVRANRGAAGVDRQTLAEVEEYGVERMLGELAADLRDGSYRPAPARRVMIPKSDGGRWAFRRCVTGWGALRNVTTTTGMPEAMASGQPPELAVRALNFYPDNRTYGLEREMGKPGCPTAPAPRPISADWVPEALAVSGLDRDELVRTGRDPGEAMTEFAAWVWGQARRHQGRAVFCAYPLGFDWLFTYWYLIRFADGGSPFGHSAHLDMKTAYAVRGRQPIARSVKRLMPRALLSARRHTHNALDDAIEQADLLAT